MIFQTPVAPDKKHVPTVPVTAAKYFCKFCNISGCLPHRSQKVTISILAMNN